MSFLQKLKDGANKATDYAQQTVKITKISTQISAKKREIERNCAEMGNAVYEAFKAGDIELADAKIKLLSEASLVLEGEIAGMEHDIEAMKNEKTCECGQKTTLDARFCQSCGHPFTFESEAAGIKDAEEEPGSKECENCGKELEAGAKFCEHCGSAQSAQ